MAEAFGFEQVRYLNMFEPDSTPESTKEGSQP